jgi:hypothetical protein
MKHASAAQLAAGMNAYDELVDQFECRQIASRHWVVSPRTSTPEQMAMADSVDMWCFDTKPAADAFLRSKIIEAIANAVVNA